MKILVHIIAGVFCVGSIIAAEKSTTDQGTTQSTAKGKTVRIRIASPNNQGKLNDDASNTQNLSSNNAARKGAPQGKIYTATDTGVYQSDGTNKKKNLTSGHKFTTQAGGPQASPKNKTGKTGVTTGGQNGQSGIDGHTRVITGNDQGVWRSGKPGSNYQGQHLLYQDTVTPSQSGNAGRVGSVAVDPSDPSGAVKKPQHGSPQKKKSNDR